MKKKTKLFYSLTTMLCLSWHMYAQVTIGRNEAPLPGALLDLKESPDGMSSRGISMPRVLLTDLSNLYPMLTGSETDYATLKTTHVGLLVYNVNTQETVNRICPGLHIWTGNKWEPLPAYPTSADRRTLVSDVLHSFTFLDPNSATNWPADKNRSQYSLGYIGSFTDSRAGDTPQTYNYTRFYVGLANRTKTYEVQENYSCSSTPVYGPTFTKEETGNYFEDGIWTNDNLRATVIDPVRDNGDLALNLTEDYNPNDSFDLVAWGYPNKDSNNKGTLGLLYTWLAATNGKQAADPVVSEGGLDEGTQVQGVCPSGWHLPSDREWTNLENAIIMNTSMFSTTPTIGSAGIIDYTPTTWRGTTHGTAMKSIAPTSGTATSGTSKTAAQGGFNGLLSGNINHNAAGQFGISGFWWSSSIRYATSSWYRHLYYSNTAGYRSGLTHNFLISVRCKKN
ncbi:FISUMP domain-containing protein [Dysgonomonas sp. ZJ279]|uniref:FISUMP domain-containing protein n=1 Tax=Dysgonomonas sp. ZJ279 TaxID=2709796 RepID=UPI0013EAE4AA|nr:FISUMP domain-containing protein [Dysgonomonas sp. ZJ279]